MKKLKKIHLKIDKEVISNLNQNNLEGIKGGAVTDVCITGKCTKLSDCCTFADCQGATKAGNACLSLVNCGPSKSGGQFCCPIPSGEIKPWSADTCNSGGGCGIIASNGNPTGCIVQVSNAPFSCLCMAGPNL